MNSWESEAKARGFDSAKKMLFHLYWNEKKSLTQIAKALSLNYHWTAVRKQMKALGIRLRPRGGNNNPKGYNSWKKRYTL